MYSGKELWKNRIPDELIERTIRSGEVIETYPGLPANLYEAVSRAVEKSPEKLAVEDSFGHSFSYAELKIAADRFASVLKYRFGVCKGDHVALMMYSSTEFCVAFLAILKLGAIAVMLPTKYRKKEVCALVEKSDLQHVICDTDYLSFFEKYRDQGISLITFHSSESGFGFSEMTEAEYPEAEMEGECEDISVMMFTSGTTSLSKGVMLANYSYMHAVAVYQKIFGVTEEDSAVIPVPIYMITGLSALFGLILFAGGTVYMQQFFNAKDVLRCVQEKKVTFMHSAPTVYALLLKEQKEFPKLESLRCLACGGGSCSIHLIRKVHDWLPSCEFRTVYGMTETASPATILPEDTAKSPEMESNGVPIPGMKMKVVDEQGEECAPRQLGEILMKGTNLLQCYYNLETPLYENGWLHTGDVGYFTEDGYCYVVERIKDMINRGGEKIIGSDVEKELLQMDGIEEAVVVGIPDEVFGEVPVAVIKMEKDVAWDEEDIQKYLGGRIASYKIPVKILFADKIPLTPNGKYDKKNMKKLF